MPLSGRSQRPILVGGDSAGKSSASCFAAMEHPVDRVVVAVRRGDWEALQPLLHPYLRWTDSEGVTIRGRRNVIARLQAGSVLAAPRECELRDGQVYRWRER